MAETDTETLPNGTGALSEEEERLKQRPADIDADVREMERRKRVEALMNSKLFREELERVLDIREMVGGRLHTATHTFHSHRGPACVLPINDIRGIEGVGYEKGEKILRCKLAAVYRLVDLFGWTQTGISGQITARLNTAVEQVLTTPRGLLPHEVTASSLVKVDMQGVVQDQGTTNFPVNVDGFSLHAYVHAARPDVRCVLHVRSPAALAVSSMRRGLLPLCHEAALLGDIAYHGVPYGILDNEERDKLVRALGPSAKVLMLSSGGALCCGGTLEEAFHQARNLTAACDVQLRLASLPLDELQLLPEETRAQIYEQSRKPPSDATKWRVGGEEFEALMRMLDNAGFRTGYIYRHPLVKNDVPKPKNDVEVPPAVSSLGYLLEEEELYKQGLWKKGQGTKGERTRWLNSPNVYQKVEVLETGTTDPKKITKWVDANTEEWVQDGSPAHSSTPVKIDTLQFVPKNTNPKEFKALQQQIKENRRADKISAGPQSHILEGVTWDEASKLVGEDAANTHTGDHVVLMGAASKGIIQRGYQHNATMYSAPYARNPFDHVTDTEIDEYRRIVERKQRGNEYDTDLSESEAVSAAQIMSTASAPSETEEESRDEHRVLRIETKQAPIRSQPEVVLSDDSVDFLNAERHHADRTKVVVAEIERAPRDPNLLPDDEVFLSSEATSPVSSPTPAKPARVNRGPIVVDSRRDTNLMDDEVFLSSEPSPVPSHRPYKPVLTRDPSQMSDDEAVIFTPAAKPRVVPVVVRQRALIHHLPSRGSGMTEARGYHESLSFNNPEKRRTRDYSRNANFENVLKIYESPKRDVKIHPKFKVSLKKKLNTSDDVTKVELGSQNVGQGSSRSSLSSIPSIEWDRCKSEYALRTRSLTRPRDREDVNRQRGSALNRLFRTRSHSGFINNFVKDPEPTHYHIPKCRSCGASNKTYAWERNKGRNLKTANSIFFSIDNIPQRCQDEVENDLNTVKVHQKEVLKVDKIETEFDESQEFNEDNYLGEIGQSYSSANQTVIEMKGIDCTKDDKLDEAVEKNDETDVYRAELVELNDRTESEDVNNNTLDSIEGEYHSFTDEIDFVEAMYESPVKTLMEKDIRDYSVPIRFYCDDYANGDDIPKKLRQKCIEAAKQQLTLLEPILEESKSSYDDSNNSTEINKDKTKNIDTDKDNQDINKEKVNNDISDMISDVFNKALSAVELQSEIGCASDIKVTAELLETQYVNREKKFNDKKFDIATNDAESISTNVIHAAVDVYGENKVSESIEDILANVCDDVLEILSNDAASVTAVKMNPYVSDNKDFRASLYSVSSGNDLPSFNSTVEFEKYEAVSDLIASILNRIDFDAVKDSNFFYTIENRIVDTNFEIETDIVKDITENAETNTESEQVDESFEFFSIQKTIDEIETNMYLNKTVSSENSENDLTQSYKIAEAIVYYLFNAAIFTCTKKDKINKEEKRVVRVVDSEDILFTAKSLWSEELAAEFEIPFEGNFNLQNINDSKANNIETCLSDDNTASQYESSSHNNLVPNEDCINVELNMTNIPTDFTIIYNNDDTYVSSDENEEIKDILNSLENLHEATNTNIDNVSVQDVLNDIQCVNCEDCAADNANPSADVENFLNETFVLDSKTELNTAFLEEEYGRSSPYCDSMDKVFKSCTESPVRNCPKRVDDLSVLYEKDDTIMGSPFIKKATVISMSQTEHTGGIKYWLSFDDSFSQTDTIAKPVRKFDDDLLPSFVSVDFDKEELNNIHTYLITDTLNNKVKAFKRNGVLLDSFNGSNSNLDSFTSAYASQTDNNTCDSKISQTEQKRLIYDSRMDLKMSQRKYSSWPVIDDSLFYRIISQFTLSESFDLDDLEIGKFDSSF